MLRICGLCSVTDVANFCHPCARCKHWHSAYTSLCAPLEYTVLLFSNAGAREICDALVSVTGVGGLLRNPH
jgi:hypothetical protein